MASTRELLAIGLGVLVGLAALLFPGVLLRVHTAGTRPDRQNGYGQGGVTSDRAVLLVRLLGAAVLVVAAVIALQAF